MHGLPGRNVSCDLHMEHMNQECKAALSRLGSNVTDRSIKRNWQVYWQTDPYHGTL